LSMRGGGCGGGGGDGVRVGANRLVCTPWEGVHDDDDVSLFLAPFSLPVCIPAVPLKTRALLRGVNWALFAQGPTRSSSIWTTSASLTKNRTSRLVWEASELMLIVLRHWLNQM